MKNKGHTLSPKENNNSPVIKCKAMVYCNLTDKELKIPLRKKFGELQGHSERQSN